MAALTAGKRLTLRVLETDVQDYAIEAAEVIYKNALVEDNGSGYAQANSGSGPFFGISMHSDVDNSGGAAGAAKCRVAVKGYLVGVTVTGVSGVGNIGDTVYAPTDNVDDLKLTNTNADAIGKISAYHADGTVDVYFQGDAVRSL